MANLFQGPIQGPGLPPVQGPVKSGIDEQVFRRTGRSVPKQSPLGPMFRSPEQGSSGSSGGNFNDVIRDAQESGAFEQEPEEPDFDFDALIAPAMSSLDEFERNLRSSQPQLLQEAEQSAGVLRGGIEAERARRTGALEQQRTRETQRTESAVSEARRQGAELLQGLQSRFGSSTGTGAFVGELTGREVLRSIAGNRQALQNTIAQIDDSLESVRRETANQLNALEVQLQQQKNVLRRELDNRIADINRQRGQLETFKAQSKKDELIRFRTQLADVEARNAALRQQLFFKFQQARGRLSTFKETAVGDFSAMIEPFTKAGLQLSGATLGSDGGLRQVTFGAETESENDEIDTFLKNIVGDTGQPTGTGIVPGVPGIGVPANTQGGASQAQSQEAMADSIFGSPQ